MSISTPSGSESLLGWIASLPADARSNLLSDLPATDLAALSWCWQLAARPNQQPPPGPWRVWLLRWGRGAGKTRTGAELVRAWAESGLVRRIALVGQTAADTRDVMVGGESGILAISPPWHRPTYVPTRRQLVWPNGCMATTYSSDSPDQLRGPQHDKAWADEIAKWQYPDDAWHNLEFGLRLGDLPQVVATTTPRPLRLIRDLLAEPTTIETRASTYDNAANLPVAFLERLRARYEGTRIGRQEIHGEILDDVPGALWQRDALDRDRVRTAPADLVRVVVAIDPAMTSGEDADETGIVVAGSDANGHAYILADRSCRLSPDGWARRAVEAYHAHEADRIVAEVNNGGDLVEHNIRTVDRRVSYRAVRASRGKRVRAEPVAALYEQGKIHHVGMLADLEDQMTAYAPDHFDGSPDRVDALVWALTDLLLDGVAGGPAFTLSTPW